MARRGEAREENRERRMNENNTAGMEWHFNLKTETKYKSNDSNKNYQQNRHTFGLLINLSSHMYTLTHSRTQLVCRIIPLPTITNNVAHTHKRSHN